MQVNHYHLPENPFFQSQPQDVKNCNQYKIKINMADEYLAFS